MFLERLGRLLGRKGKVVAVRIPWQRFAQLQTQARSRGTTVGSLIARAVCSETGDEETADRALPSGEERLIEELMDANAAYAVMKRRAFEAEQLAKRLELAHGAITNENRMLREDLAQLRQELRSARARGTHQDGEAEAGGSSRPADAPNMVESFMQHWGGGSARKTRPPRRNR